MTDETKNENETLAADIAEGAESAPADGETLAQRIVALEQELAAAKQETLYAMADTQNVRRRMEKELGDARAYAATNFARDVLSVADNLSRALDAIPAELREDDKMKSLIIGLEATGKELESVLRKNGVEKFVSVGEALDPNKHQAMVEMPVADTAPGTIVHEMQAGYMIKDRLLRPALVGVAKAAE
ncbi:nucleotide exchange factor GrpE [Sphingobium nicotianae]|uniref:Protein GrpE n=1 Tax=Sphingobium nicotianae TaxID=2782607 RepID=A0A9X1DD14_9SPHN|nr:nucleotide exchange factor GrpE [Sphingobium nicotianae]MBT2187930.1 nucleotide exchange factor GrpE [Sphingobium nicotianae]